jgi:hypothetical protein
MQPKEVLECKTHQILKMRMRADLRVYQDAVDLLEANTGAGLEKAQKLAEAAKIAFEAARIRFNTHVSSHKCEVRYIHYGTRPTTATFRR